ncbi:MAG: M23 family metallopeptidase [Treponema sp.]|nr:M23 family metallopeptidase [Treponema sp.]
MMSIELNNFKEQLYRYIFRLIAVLFLVLLINPGQYIKIIPSGSEHGIGGGHYSGEIIPDADDEFLLTLASHSIDEETIATDEESLSKTRFLFYDYHLVQRGDNISGLAYNLGLNQDTIISINKITNSRLLQAGRVLKIPNQDGIIHTVRNNETLSSIAERYKADQEAIKTANELFSDFIANGTDLFVPGARLDWERLQEINGDLFIWPVNGALTSYYGWRRSPFNRNVRQFHNGIDIRGSIGTPVRAAMAGRVGAVGYDNVFGNYIIINHHSGYRTLYGHLSVIRTRTGAYVAQGERIGDVGNTGQSTGPHLHFTVYKNGATVNPRALMR